MSGITILRKWLIKKPSWRLRCQSLRFEIGPFKHLIKGRLLNQVRWEGRFGWGPRFKGWQKLIDGTPLINFAAHQWRACAQGVIDNISLIPEDRKFVLRYEDFIKNPKVVLEDIFAFLHLEFPEGFMETIPEIMADNCNKWPHALSAEELKDIGPIIGKTMIELGYEKDLSWLKQL